MSRNTIDAVRERTALAKALERARTGSVDSLWNFYRSLGPTTRCTADAVEMALAHLSNDPVPQYHNQGTPTPQVPGERAVPCILIIDHVTRNFRRDGNLKKEVVALLAQSCDALFDWMRFCLHLGLFDAVRDRVPSPYLFASRLLWRMTKICPTLQAAMFSSTTFVSLVVRIWVDKADAFDTILEVVKDSAERERNGSAITCPIARVLLELVKEEEGKQAFFQWVNTRPSRARTRFVFATIRRAEEGRQVLEEGVIGPSEMISFLKDLILLVEMLVQSDTFLRHSFDDANYISRLSYALYRISTALILHEATQHMDDLAEPAMRLGYIVFHLICYRIGRGCNSLLEGRYLGLIANIQVHLIEDGCSHSLPYTNTLLQDIGKYCAYLPALDQYGRSAPIPQETMARLRKNATVKDTWETLSRVQKFRLESREEGELFPSCDNLLCSRSLQASFTPRQCGHCSTVTYCSDECQEQDWEKFHRAECSSARRLHSWRKEWLGTYSHRTRSFHAALMQDYYNHERKIIEQQASERHPDLPLDQIIPHINMVTMKTDISTHPYSPDTQWDGGGRGAFCVSSTQLDYLKPRYHAFVKPGASGHGGSDVRILEATFPVSQHHVAFLAVHLQKEGNQFEATKSLARFGTCRPKSPSK